MRIQVISMKVDQNHLGNEKYILDCINSNMDLNDQIIEIEITSKNEILLLANYFGIELLAKSESIFIIKKCDNRKIQEKWLKKNYDNWIHISNRANTMDEYGVLLELIKIMKTGVNPKYWIIKE